MEKTNYKEGQNENSMKKNKPGLLYDTIGSILHDSPLRQIEEIKARSSWSGVMSHYTDLDKITNGWQRGELTIIAGRPSMGKTSFLLSMVGDVCVDGKVPTGFISLEMGEYQFLKRLFCINSYTSIQDLFQDELNEEDNPNLEATIRDIATAPLYVDFTPNLTVAQVRERAIDMVAKHGIKQLIIDYLQLLECDNRNTVNRYEEISSITRQLKKLAKELNIPILVSSQMNRKAVPCDDYDYELSLSDLRDSGTIEEDADVVCFIDRPAVYGIMSDKKGNDLRNQAIIKVAKNRSGHTGELLLRYCYEDGGFVDYF